METGAVKGGICAGGIAGQWLQTRCEPIHGRSTMPVQGIDGLQPLSGNTAIKSVQPWLLLGFDERLQMPPRHRYLISR